MNAQDDLPREPNAQVRDEASALWSDAKDVAQSIARSQQRAAAQSLGDFAGALRHAAREVDGDNAAASQVAASVAGSLERLSSTLREGDLNTLVRDAEDFARAQPLVFFGAAVATGFLAMRFLKSSETARSEPRMSSNSSS